MMRLVILPLYTIIAYILLYAFTSIVVIFSLLMVYTGFEKAAQKFIWFWAKTTFFIIGKKLRIVGKENIDFNRRYVLTANHNSLFDIMAIMSVFPDVSWFGREYLVQIPVFGTLLKAINYVPMKTKDIRNTKQMIGKLISNSDSSTVAIFPEGTRTTNGEVGKFRKGFIHVLRASELDLLPVTLKGFYDFKPKTRFSFDFNVPLSIVIHPSMPFDTIKDINDNELAQTTRKIIASAL